MNKKEIEQFIKAFEDFMKHSETEEFYFNQRSEYDRYQKESKKIIENEIEKKAAELQITCDYYMAEFM